jgi:serine/threonine protein kinase/tetratricopeptide (TPR) repeat protein
MGDNASNESIGRRYRILGMLGQGGMGTVLLAKDRLDGRVALKRLAPSADPWGGALAADLPTPQLLSVMVGATAAGVAAVGANTFVPMRSVAPDSATVASMSSTEAPPQSGIGMASTMWHGARPTEPVATVPRMYPRAASTAVRAVEAPPDGALAEMLRLTLAREFRLLSSLRHPNIISVLDYGFDDELLPYFTMELLEGAETILQAARGRPLAGKVDLLAQMLQALAYLHRRGVIHRDLKPGNVMVVDGRVKVLDFGVSILREREAESGRFIVGTLAYMAPELLGGGSATESSDLYAVGVIAYEIFAGRYPFPTSSVLALREAILHDKPAMHGIDPEVAPIVARLLSKRAEDRPSGVDEVIAALSSRTGQPLSVETAATRESFLQAAELVGRDAELLALSEMLGNAATGKGSGALVGGESGVGKSRLIDELRARALVDGVVVLRGQAVREGGPYHAFRDVLRGLVLRSEPDDLEAAVLQAVVPDIAALLDRDVPSLAAIDPEAAQARLSLVIDALLRRHKEPMLIVVEDLHWAGSETLRLLAEIARVANELPLLLVGTYRDDERPQLHADLPGMRVVKLKRLGPEGIAALAASMLGEAGRRPVVIERLSRETEGNPFFLVEVVRALAEDAGALSRVGQEPMPETVTAGGVHLIVRRRLDQVPRRARPLLEAAAVIGRRIDPALLHRLEPAVDLDTWLETCADVAVLEVDEKSYRFAHDKLREGLLADLGGEAARALNRRIAEAIEAVYPGSSEHVAALARHWAIAGDTAKEAHYATLAGEQALQSSAYREAVAYFERAAAILSANVAAEPEDPLSRARRALAAIVPIGREPVAKESDRFRLGLLEGRLAEAYGRLSNHPESFRRGERALAILGRPMPHGQVGMILGLPVQAALRAVMSAWPDRFVAASSDARAVHLEATRIQNRVTESCFYTQDFLPMMWSGLALLNLGEPAGPSADLACGYALMAAVAGTIPLNAMADAWSDRALELVERVGSPYHVAFVLQRVASYHLWMTRFAAAEAGFQREIDIARRIGDQRLLGDAMICAIFAANYQGQFKRAAEMFREVEAWTRKTGDPQAQTAGPIAGAMARLRLGDVDRALALCQGARPFVDASPAVHDDIRCYGVLSLAALRSGDARLAREAAERVLAIVQSTRPVAYWTHDGMVSVTEATLALWEASKPADRAALERMAKQAVRGMEAFAKVFPIGEPFALLFRGLYEQLAGRAGAARKAWERCLAAAVRLRMPYDEGRAHLEIGRHLGPRDHARRRHLERALAIFTELGTVPDEKRAREALGIS